MGEFSTFTLRQYKAGAGVLFCRKECKEHDSNHANDSNVPGIKNELRLATLVFASEFEELGPLPWGEGGQSDCSTRNGTLEDPDVDFLQHRKIEATPIASMLVSINKCGRMSPARSGFPIASRDISIVV